MAFRVDALRVGKADSTAALQGSSASGMRREMHQGLHGQSGVKRLRVGASVGADCSRRLGIDRYRATATAPDCVLRQHGARGADMQRNSPPLVTDHKGGGGDRTYVVGKHIVDRGEATLACQAVLDVLRHRVVRVWIDAYSDYADELPPW